MDMTNVFPVRFYGYDSIIYVVSAIIGFLISYNAYKMYKFTNQKNHFLLFISFLIISIGFFSMSITSLYTYIKFFSEEEAIVFNSLFDVADVGYWIYFISAFIAYALLVMIYFKNDKNKFLMILPISLSYYTYFNVILFAMIGLVALKSVMNFLLKKNKTSFLVMSSFALIAIYHGILMFARFSKLCYVAAHFSLIMGFLSLLVMLVLVNKSWK